MNENIRHKGRVGQTFIYLGKLLRMFVYQSDWKVLPMGAIIASVVTFVVGANLFVTQEGTLMGAFALVCVCIWNGFFNSIQVVCRERGIVKREHRSGMHISSYVMAQMIYQFMLCLAQTVITLVICNLSGVQFPQQGIIFGQGILDVGITLLLITFAADMMALMVSCVVRTTTTAMTVMPFLLIFQLVFSGGFFQLAGFAKKITVLTISRWGLDSLCAVGRYNELRWSRSGTRSLSSRISSLRAQSRCWMSFCKSRSRARWTTSSTGPAPTTRATPLSAPPKTSSKTGA